MIPSSLRHLVKLLLRPNYRSRHSALQKLRRTPRYTPTSTNLLGTEIEVVDAASFLFMYKEIFEERIYRFKARKEKPTIIDCGANIGISILYFKELYPYSHIIAFEPDTKVFKSLKKNILKFNLSDIELFNKAVWSSENILEFMSEGADGGRVTQLESDRERYQVPTVRLRDYLIKPVDFLKLDIEGAETEVIKDCQDLLFNIDNLFIEYHSFVNETQTLHIIINILSKAGFRLHIHPSLTSPQPFCDRSVSLGMDMQLNIFAFRE